MENPFAMPTAAAPAPQPTPTPAPVAQPAPVAPAASYGDDPFGAPAPQADRPRVLDMLGRLLLIMPKKIETVPNKKKPGTTQERMTADVIVLDGGPLAYGGAPEKPKPIPHTKTGQIPMKVTALYISQVGLVSQCQPYLLNYLAKNGGKTMALGRLDLGEAKDAESNPPYLLRSATPEEAQVARAWLAANPAPDPFA